ncbi:MFS transporter [Bacillus sp. BRMEA1]|uniref:MFS transporter n=1 Tax=Neobacillus endophyticus TaxID=2738405 RepID=UPI001564718F|nr:MFS transporter [Neobacillus endophyticus]NRD76824.1 MFS transporter [Neobacillus endophyticus]
MNSLRSNNRPFLTEKLWTAKFITLWQAQLVSTFGDAFYNIALGVWTLAATHSTAYMGILLGISSLAGVLVSPFAGVWVDRLNRKRILILMDVIRGICIVLVALAAFQMVIKIWMVTIAGIVLGVCGAIFRPALNSVIPDLIPEAKIENATSAFSIVSSSANMFGSASGGYLLQLLGAPCLFFINGFSYLFSCLSICFIKIPTIKKRSTQHFMEDLKSGFQYIWNFEGLRSSLILVASFNFLSYIAVILFLPFFQFTNGLGIGKYGLTMGCFMFGAMAGYILMTILKIPANSRFMFFILSVIASNIFLILSVHIRLFILMALFVLAGGFFNAIINVMLLSIIQISTPQEMRGKVQSFVSIASQGLTPIAMAAGGILGRYFSIKLIITLAFFMVIVVTIPFAFNKRFRTFMSLENQHVTGERAVT